MEPVNKKGPFKGSFLNRFYRLGREDVGHLFAVVTAIKVGFTAFREAHNPFNKREDRVVLAEGDVATREDLGTSLTNNDGAGLSLLAIVELRAQILWVRVS